MSSYADIASTPPGTLTAVQTSLARLATLFVGVRVDLRTALQGAQKIMQLARS
jgi:hypothetical protein